MHIPTIVLVEHDPAAQTVIELTLRQRVPCKLSALRYAYEIDDTLTKLGHVDLLILDLLIPDADAVELIAELRHRYPTMRVAVTAGVREEARISEALEAGAIDYLKTTDSPERLASLVQGMLAAQPPGNRAEPMQTRRDPFDGMVGGSKALSDVKALAQQAAESDIPVLISGESGVGKERVAQAIHQASARANQPFQAINCGAIPPNLVESTLFGHVKGAFTGAVADAPGLFREADGGTVFLDEVGELPLDVQVKLLRVLQEAQVQPVGAQQPVAVNIRVISATHVNLEQAINEGHFREDLYYRLHVFPLHVPTLKARGQGDIEALAMHFLTRFARQESKPVSGIAKPALRLLCDYHWPGNIRQLENAVYRAVVLAKDDTLQPQDFTQISNALNQQQLVQARQHTETHLPGQNMPMPAQYHLSLRNEAGEFKPLRQIESEVMQQAVSHYRWRITDIANALGVTRATVYKKLKNAGLEDPRNAA